MLAWRYMPSIEIGRNSVMLELGCGAEQGDGAGFEVAAVGLDKIEARPGTRGVLRIGSSVSPPRLEWQSDLVVPPDHKVSIAVGSV